MPQSIIVGSRGAAVIVTLFAAAFSACQREAAQPQYEVQPLLQRGSPFHGVHGLRFDRHDTLYAVSVIGQSVYTVDTATGKVATFVGPPDGMGDDIAIAPDDGTFVWTAIEDGIVHMQTPGGSHRRLMENQKGVNGVTFSPDGKRLFVSLVFYGDALYELDRTGAKPPRKIVENIGGLNAFQMAEDGLIYGPLLFKGQIVAINPDTGAIKVVSTDFKSPGALKLDGKGSAYVLEGATDEVMRVDLKTGRATSVAKLPHGVDNLALDSKGRLFVALSEVNGISEIDLMTGAIREVVPPAAFNSATGLSVSAEGGAERLYVGDLFGGVKIVDATSKAITHTSIDLFQPTHVFATSQHLLAVSEVFGTVQRFDRSTLMKVAEWTGLRVPGDAIELASGDIVAAETATGNLVRLAAGGGDKHDVIASGLGSPRGLAPGEGSTVYVTDSRGGRIVRVDVKTKAASPLAEGLERPEGVAVDADGSLLVVEVGAKRLSRIAVSTGARTLIASELPIGLSYGPSLYRAVAVAPSGIYFNSDIDNTIYRITAAR